MAELVGLARAAFLEAFLPAYNTAHGARYSGEPDEVEHTDWDYRWRGVERNEPPLLVQHTRAHSNVELERRKPAIASKWNYDELQAPLLADGLRGYKVSLQVRALPWNRTEREAMGTAIRDTILRALAVPLAEGEHRSLPPYESTTGSAEIEIANDGGGLSGISVRGPGFEFDEGNTAARAVLALRKKQARLGPQPSEVVLAIFFDITPYDDSDVAAMVSDLRGESINFREVWAVSPWQPGSRADRLWPS